MSMFHRSRALCAGVVLVGIASSVLAAAPAHAAAGLSADAGDASVIEGNTKARNLFIPITLTKPATQSDVVVKYQILKISAKPGVPSKVPDADFNNKGGVEKSLLFKRVNGRTPVMKVVSVPIYPDTDVEGQETFAVQINDVVGGGTAGASTYQTGRLGIGTIVDDDAAGSADVGVGDSTVVEGDSLYRAIRFTVSLSAPQASDVSVQYDVVSGSADCVPFSYGAPTQLNADCSAVTNKTLVFKRGANGFTPAFKTISVQVVGDTIFEDDQTFHVHLHDATGLTITQADGTGLILEDGD